MTPCFGTVQVRQDERKFRELAQPGDNWAAQRTWITRTTTLSSVSRTGGVAFNPHKIGGGYGRAFCNAASCNASVNVDRARDVSRYGALPQQRAKDLPRCSERSRGARRERLDPWTVK